MKEPKKLFKRTPKTPKEFQKYLLAELYFIG